jgi:hypothetical protein
MCKVKVRHTIFNLMRYYFLLLFYCLTIDYIYTFSFVRLQDEGKENTAS